MVLFIYSWLNVNLWDDMDLFLAVSLFLDSKTCVDIFFTYKKKMSNLFYFFLFCFCSAFSFVPCDVVVGFIFISMDGFHIGVALLIVQCKLFS